MVDEDAYIGSLARPDQGPVLGAMMGGDGGGGGPPPPSTSFATWAATRRALSSITHIGVGIVYGNSPNLINNSYAESGAGGLVASGWDPGDYYQIDMAAEVVCDGLRVYVGDNTSWAPSGTYTQKATLLGSNDPAFGTYETLATGIEFGNGGLETSGTYLEEADVTDGTAGNWRRTYGWPTPATAYRYYRLLWESGAGYGYWYTTELTFRVSA